MTSPSWLSPNSPPYKSHQEVYSICILEEHKLAVLSIYSHTLDKSVFCLGSAQSTGSDSAHKSTPHLGSPLELTPWLRTQFSQTWGQESWTSPHNLPCGGMDESKMPSPPNTVSPTADKGWPWSHKSGRASSKPNQWQHTREQVLPPVWAVHWGWPYCLGCRWADPGGMKATKLTHFPSSAIPELGYELAQYNIHLICKLQEHMKRRTYRSKTVWSPWHKTTRYSRAASVRAHCQWCSRRQNPESTMAMNTCKKRWMN